MDQTNTLIGGATTYKLLSLSSGLPSTITMCQLLLLLSQASIKVQYDSRTHKQPLAYYPAATFQHIQNIMRSLREANVHCVTWASHSTTISRWCNYKILVQVLQWWLTMKQVSIALKVMGWSSQLFCPLFSLLSALPVWDRNQKKKKTH